MKIMVIAKLSNGKLRDKLEPITKITGLSEIEVVRYKKGINLPKTKYYHLPKFLVKYKFIQLFSIFIMIPLRLLINRPNFIIGIFYLPWGLFAQFFGSLFGIQVIINLIGRDINELSQKKILWFILVNLLKRCKIITTTGKQSKEILIRNDIKPSRIIVLPNPINTTRFFPTNIKKIYDLISISNLIPRKRIDLLLEAIILIKGKYPDIKVAIVGDGPSKYNLIKQCKKFNIERNVLFLGHRNEIPKLINQSKIFILTSESEGLPVSMLEAMACGLPVVVTKVGDILDMLVDNYNSLLIPTSDYKALSKKILYLLDNPSERDRIGKNAIKIKDSNSVEVVIRKWEELVKR